MPLTVRELDVVIKKLQMTTRDNGHRFCWFEHNGKKILFTERSHGRGEIGRVEHTIRRQLKVSSEQMQGLIQCSMSRDAYVEHLKAKGAITRDPPSD